jgi:hypothetical protein
MANVGELTTFILGAFKSEDDGRVALYHYLKNFFPSETPITPLLINEFYSEALYSQYWQERKSNLQSDVQEVVQRFFSQSNDPFRLDLLWDISKFQIIQINQSETLCLIVREFEQTITAEGETFRVMPESDSRAISVRRTSLGEVVVRTYSNLARIQGSKLVPLKADQEIFYDPGMELKRGMFHKLRPAQHTQVRFIAEGNQDVMITAQFVNGFAFRQSQTLNLGNISQESRIFFPLKRLERFYIYRPSDPYYMELISTMERALLMLQTHKDGAFEFARQAFDGGQIAFDQIFPDDKALYSRLRELAKWISSPAYARTKEVTNETQRRPTSPSP